MAGIDGSRGFKSTGFPSRPFLDTYKSQWHAVSPITDRRESNPLHRVPEVQFDSVSSAELPYLNAERYANQGIA